MSKTKVVTFRATVAQVQKLELLAAGEGSTVSDICSRIVDLMPTQPVSGLRLAVHGQQGDVVSTTHLDSQPA